ncbi:MAG: YbaB/EbfC family nucleoid-associated protein [Firmicutes bacterium]|nr:YbaB/EbfC family nucleoid-associated protein [Bacillota bacterium]
MTGEETLGLTDSLLKSVMSKVIKQLEQKTVEGSAGGGAVRVLMSGKQRVIRVSISPRAAEDIGKLEKMVLDATNMALSEARELLKTELKKLVGNIPWPEDFIIP